MNTVRAEKGKIKLDDILHLMEEYYKGDELDLVRKSYVLSARAHSGQKRHSGEPYMVHPLHVAKILSEMNLDVATVVTGLLHDTVEDTLVTLDEIRDLFGDSIARLVDGVTKLSKIQFSSREARQAENFRKMFMAMAKDIRVIFVKLADRLHNMRTLHHLPEEKRQRIALETLEIYAPIAGRLGIQEIKVELEDLAFRHSKPEVWAKLNSQAARLKKKSEKFISDIEKKISVEMRKYQLKGRVYGRLKHNYSIFRKMEGQNLEFDQVYDVIAFRVVLEDIAECYQAIGLIHMLWRPVPGRFKDYIGMPKLNNYQSLHTTVIGPDGQRIEFQVRTRYMHELAEWGVASHWKYKEKSKLAKKDEDKFRWMRQFMEWQKDVSDPAEYLDIVKLDLFASDVYVFAPDGNIREFPRGSTPIDFAYAIHTDVGEKCSGARVNGRIVPLRYILRSGDTVEIIKRADSKPSKDWLKYVQTSKARSHIRQFIRSQERARSETIGRELLVKEFSKHQADLHRLLKGVRFQTFFRNKNIDDVKDLYMRVGYGKLTPREVAVAIIPSDQLLDEGGVKLEETTIAKIFKRATQQSRGVVKVQGIDDVLVALGKCCSPIPGDNVVGYVTRGRGVTVHRVDCSRALSIDIERRIDVAWDDKADTLSSVKIKMIAVDSPGLLAQVSKEISARGVNIANAQCRSIGDKKAQNTFELGVKNSKDLNQLIHSLEKIKGVISVERVSG
jgi:GTP diphosphokinase / guanosine-3',5'-bis(diphosphate) 3'-diphosphatase